MLRIHRAETADVLASALGDLLATSPSDPFAREVICVPTRGMERWLAQQLATRLGTSDDRADGVCANVDSPSPSTLLTDAIATACDIDPRGDPWRPEHSTWPLLEIVEEHLGEPWLALLATHLGHGDDPLDDVRRPRRLGTVRHLAGLFDRYAAARPGMLEAWAAGRDVDDAGTPLPEANAWQAELYRRLRTSIGGPDIQQRLALATQRLREDPALVDLPGRLALFGLTRLAPGQLQILDALASSREVHLFLLHPSPALWQAVAAAIDGQRPEPRRTPDHPAPRGTSRLLASWGQDARELQLVLARADTADEHHPPGPPPDTLLGRLQAAVRDDAPPPPGDARPVLDPADRSVQVHACHGRGRQVEIVRDAILHLLQSDPTLEPRDILVMCPDIETFAPLIQATFGAAMVAEKEDGDLAPPAEMRPPDLRIRLADRALRQTNPVLGAMAEILDIADQRLTASQVLDLADRAPLRRRFRLDDDDLARLRRWVAESGTRWGLDQEHRRTWRLDTVARGTWRTGLDRLLVGAAIPAEAPVLFSGIVPMDDVDSGSLDLAGRFAELMERVGRVVDAFADEQPLAGWVETLRDAADMLLATSDRDSWQRMELERLLEGLATEGAGRRIAVTLPEIRAMLSERLQGRPTRANFRTGHLTVCTLQPMRSVPHRVICLLGLDDEAFPRKAPRDGDDLLLAEPRIGERDPRAEDRQMLLDALMAATEHLVVTYTGNDDRTNEPRPPAVPVGELLEVIDATVRTPDDRPAREAITVKHPLQPFDPRNFVTGALVTGEPWSFEQVMLAGARRVTGDRPDPRPFFAAPLSPRETPVVQLDDLVSFAQNPVRAFLRQRLQLNLRDYTDELPDGLPVELDGLGKWAVGDRMLHATLAGTPGRLACKAEIERGTLPPGLLGQPIVNEAWPLVEQLAQVARSVVPEGIESVSLDVDVDLAGGRRLRGTVAGVYGEALRAASYSRLKPAARLAGWVRWLALTATHPQRPFSAFTVARRRYGGVCVARFLPVSDDQAEREAHARGCLELLIDLYDRGMREPLPIFCAASAAFAEATVAGGDPERAGRKEWETPFGATFDSDDRDVENVLVLDGELTFDELLDPEVRDDECGPDWDDLPKTRFGRYALRLWGELLAREEVVNA